MLVSSIFIRSVLHFSLCGTISVSWFPCIRYHVCIGTSFFISVLWIPWIRYLVLYRYLIFYIGTVNFLESGTLFCIGTSIFYIGTVNFLESRTLFCIGTSIFYIGTVNFLESGTLFCIGTSIFYTGTSFCISTLTYNYKPGPAFKFLGSKRRIRDLWIRYRWEFLFSFFLEGTDPLFSIRIWKMRFFLLRICSFGTEWSIIDPKINFGSSFFYGSVPSGSPL